MPGLKALGMETLEAHELEPEHPVWLVKGAEWPSQVSPKLETDKNQRNGQLLIKTWLVWADC